MNLTTIAIIWFGGLRIDAGGDAGRRADRLPAIRHADHVLAADGLDDVRHGAARAGVGGAHQRGAGRCARNQRPGAGAHARGAKKGFVEFQNVTFSYPGAEEPALSDISFTRQPRRSDRHHRRHRLGQVDAGQPDPALLRRGQRQRSWSTASTCARCRRRTCARGSASCRRRPCSSPARSPTTSATAKTDATDDEVRHAAEIAQATEFITAMPEGFDSPDRAGRHQRLRRAEAAALHRARPGAPARDLRLRRQLLGARLQDRRQPARGAAAARPPMRR